MESTTENVVECVNAILKTLECSICLELLKNPVSTGCGHFFCRFCITETLQTNYRAPCPLCKKSFTRRGIQEAHQRKSILAAVKELADVCETFADVKFFNKECSQRQVEVGKVIPALTSVENQSSSLEKATRTSTGRKRKSNVKEKDSTTAEVNNPLPVLEKMGSISTDTEPVKDANHDSSNDEVIPTSNKRYRQSLDDSDSDGLPDLKTLFQNCSSKVSDEQSSIVNESPIPPTVLAAKTSDFETNKNLNREQDINSGTKNISSSAETSVKDSPSVLLKRIKFPRPNADKSKQPMETQKSTSLKIGRKKRLVAQNPRRKNENNPLRNKTNEHIVDETTNNNINIALNVIEEADKNINTVVPGKIDENGSNEEVIKENIRKEDVGLFLSPVKKACKKSDLKNARSPKKTKSSNSRKNDNLASSSEEEENLVKKLNEAENFELIISKDTIPSTVLVSNNIKECFSLNEINLPESNKVNKTIDNVKKTPQCDDIADTAVSVQTVASPKTDKIELTSRSPGWSKVKQVGKDFRVKKFSRLSVEKNSSHSCPTEIPNADETKSNSSSSESLEIPKFNKLHNSKITKAIHSEGLLKNSERVKSNKNSFLENKVTCNKQSINCLEQISKGEKKVEVTTASSESDKYPNSMPKDIDEMDFQTETDVHIAGNENCVSLEESKDIDKNRKSNITEVLSNDCSSSERHDLTSAFPANNHILSDLQLSSISEGRNEPSKSTQNSCNPGKDYEGENMFTDDEVNMEVDNFSEKDEHLNQSKNYASCIDIVEKEISIQKPEDNLINEVYNPSEININPDFQDHYIESEPYVESILSSEKTFLKPNLKILPNASVIKENKLLSKISKISSKSIFDKDENVYYTEHSQQTSQRLLEFCNDGQRKQNSFAGSVAALNVPIYCAPNTHAIVANRNWYNQIEMFNPMKFGLGPQNPEKTKVLKRTCLTLDEIQEAFTNSSMSGTAETICSLPFSSGDFRLHVCVSEDTLNISVLKVVDSESEAANIVQATKIVAEKNVQTSNKNQRVNSTVEILPSSNPASDSSQPDQGLSDGNTKMKNNIFPYLSKYFPDTEPSDQPCSDVKEALLNNSEIIPFQGNEKSLNRNRGGNLVDLEEGVESNFLQNDINNAPNSLLISNKDEINRLEFNEGNTEICVVTEEKTKANAPKLNNSSESLPPTQPNSGSKQNRAECQKYVSNNRTVDTIEPFDEVLDKNLTSCDKVTELTDWEFDKKLQKSKTVDKKNEFSKHEESVKPTSNAFEPYDKGFEKDLPLDKVMELNDRLLDEKLEKSKIVDKTSKREESNELMSDDEENILFDELVYYQKTSPTKLEINDSDGLSSDPAMAFATQLVAPLKTIAAKMNSAGSNKNVKKQPKEKSSDTFNAREKRSLQEFEELVFNLSKNSTNDASVNKPSRLSLKSKRSAKKFKRIKKFDSDDDSDSDSAHPSKDESSATKRSSAKDKMENVREVSLKTKGKELACESLQEQSTLNSFCSEDITSKDPNQLVKEVEVLDKEIYSVVEQLKQYGREDVLKRVLEKLHTECEKESPVSEENDKDQCMSDDSEDSTDIFSQSVPPTPPDNVNSKNDSGFKSSHYNHN